MPAKKRAQSPTTNVILDSVNPEQWLNAIRVVRSLNEDFGLKEAKELVDRVREGKPQNLLINCTRHKARVALAQLAEVKAKARTSKTIVPMEPADFF